MMESSKFPTAPLGLGAALEERGFDHLTDIQQAVLSHGLTGRDLRISSRTGSGKTVALGMAAAEAVANAARHRTRGPAARPAVLVVAPTRELAVQISGELTWLYKALAAEVGSLTGGTALHGDLALLRRDPTVVVGTPGRLLDHLRRGTLALDALDVITLDEADEMLDMGFAEEITELLEATPDNRRTHLMSATFPPSVQSMAERYQDDPLVLSCDDPHAQHSDIEFRTMEVWPGDRLAALINLLLLDPDAKTLVFVRTRAGASELTGELARHGFPVRLLSGELSQGERTATLTSFRFNGTKVLVATDVAARGLDVPDIAQVVHMDLPDNPELLTHRSGRTGRAGRKGTCTVMVSPRGRRRLDQMLRSAGIEASRARVPSPMEIHRAADQRLLESFAEQSSARDDSRFEKLAEELLAGHDPVRLVAELVARSEHGGPCQPRSVEQPQQRPERRHDRPSAQQRGRTGARSGWVRFQVSWGRCHGADERRLLAVVCRRGGIRSNDVGSIAVGERSSMVEVSERTAQAFARAATRPDERDPRVHFRKWQDAPSPHRSDRRSTGR